MSEGPARPLSRIAFEALPEELRTELEPRVRRLGYLGEFFQAAAHQPTALLAFIRFTEQVKAALPWRIVEAIALTVSARTGNAYERVQHERLASSLGMPRETITAYLDGRTDAGMAPEEAAAAALAAAVADRHGHGAGPAFDRLLALTGEEVAVASLMLTARYLAHSAMVNTWMLRPPVPATSDSGRGRADAPEHGDARGAWAVSHAAPARVPLTGSYTPLVTPFQDGNIDYEAFEQAVERQVSAGSSGIVVTGTTGEPTSLTLAERAELYRRAVDVAAGRIGVVAATGCADQPSTLQLTGAAEAAGADAVLVVAPPFVKPSPSGLVDHFVAAGRSTSLPLLIYNIPGRAAVTVTLEVVQRVGEALPTLTGLKHASADLDFVTELVTQMGDDFRVFCGLESYSYPMLAVGAAGLMSAVGNLFPAEVAALCHAVTTGDHATALTLHRRLFAVNRAVFLETNPIPLKHMLALAELGSAETRPPLAQASDDTRQRVATVLEQFSSSHVTA